MRRLVNTVVGGIALTMFAACGGGDQGQTTQQAPAATAAAKPDSGMAMGNMANMQLPAGVTMEMVAQGDSIFHGAGQCQTCHGADAKGTPLAPDLTDDTWLNTTGRNYDEIVKLVTTGVPQPKQHPSPMPAKGGSTITDDQVKAVAAYVLSLGHH